MHCRLALILYDNAMLASLPMYDWPEVREWTNRWWNAIAARLGIAVPLCRDGSHVALWRQTGLLFSQTCGYPFTHEFTGKLTLVGTPHYGVDGCSGPDYQSFIFARKAAPLEAFRHATAAVNSPDSMSGMLALKLVFAPLATGGRFFGKTVTSGGHLKSMAAVRDGLADVCAIDAVCVGLARRYRPDYLEGLVEIARSPMVPGLPYITISGDVVALRGALSQCFADEALRDTRDHLFLTGYSETSAQDYDRITELEMAIQQAGGLELL